MMKRLILLAVLFYGALATAGGFDLAGMDRTASPGDDFYRFANGNWQRQAVVPPGRAFIYSTDAMRRTANDRLTAILHQLADDPASRTGIFYRSYMDVAQLEQLGLAPARPWLDELKALPDKQAVAVTMGRYTALGVSTFLSGSVDLDDHHPGYYTLHWVDDGLGMGDRAYYQPDTAGAAEVRQAYLDYLATLLQAAGVAAPTAAAQQVMQFETALASPKPIDSATPVYDAVTLPQLQQRLPGVPWPEVVAALGWPATHPMLLDQPQVLQARVQAFRQAPLETVRNYLLTRFLQTYGPYLPRALAQPTEHFTYEVLAGASAIPSREERAIRLINRSISDEMQARYVAQYFPPQAKAQAQQLAEQLRQAFAQRLRQLPWMDPAAKQRALKKLANVRFFIGYPDHWQDYQGLSFAPGQLFANMLRVNQWSYAQSVASLDQPIAPDKWTCLFPATVNACSDNQRLVLYFPAGELQAPQFDADADAASNYGQIGVTMAHELTHQFDPSGSTYDENGLRHPWWPRSTSQRFAARTQALVEQFDAYHPAPGLTVNGRLTLAENVADLGGLNIALDAYRASLEGKPAPIIDGLSGEQRFFIAYAQGHRAKYTEQGLRAQMLNVHAPDPFRALEVRNLDAWYQAFAVQPGDRLYLPPAQRVRIW